MGLIGVLLRAPDAPYRRQQGTAVTRYRHRLVRLATWKDDLSVPVLDSIHGPDDLKALRADQLPALAAEIRTFLVDSVSKTGGHLGPNLGVVELTIALHRVFDSPRDAIVLDTGHQAYVHKLLTGRPTTSTGCGRRAGSPATRAGPSPSTTSSRTPTPRRRCPGPTASPRRYAAPRRATGTSSPSSATAR